MCQWKFFVLRYRAKRSVSKRVNAPAISLVASDLRSVGVSSGASRRAFTLIESIAWSPCRVFRLANVFCEGGRAAVIGNAHDGAKTGAMLARCCRYWIGLAAVFAVASPLGAQPP